MRFPEYTGEWKTSSVEDCLIRLENGANYDANDIEGLPMSRIETISTSHIDYSKVGHSANLKNAEHYKMNYGDILFSHINSVRHIGKTAYYEAEKPLYHGMNLLLLRCGQEIDSKFFFYLLNNRHFLQRCQVLAKQAVNQASISISDLRKIGIYVPQHDEQERIAKFLSIIDERITTQIRIIEDLRNLKTYIHNRVFSKVNTLFGQRNTIRLSDIATKITRKNKGNTINNVLSNSAAMGIVPQAEVFDKEIANEDNTANYYVIENGDFVYNPRKSAQAPFGPINMYKGQAKGIISPLYLCFQVTDINKNYLLHYFMSNVWYSYIYSNGDTGVRHDRVSIKDETFLNMPLYIHTVDKQQEIANMMEQVDAKIALEELYLTKFQKQKDYLLSAMFV